MRFLQTEWHRHERDRNAWEIERGEMKSRIAILEGEAKKSKPTHDALSKHIKMLELSLRKEREKVRSLSKGEEVDMKDAKELAREQLKAEAGKGKQAACNCKREALLTYLRFSSGQCH
jgi:striatin 1/3/4